MENRVKTIPMNSKDMVYQLLEYAKTDEIEYMRGKHNKIEYGVRLPIFVYALHSYIDEHGKLPSQSEFYDYYLEVNKDNKVINSLDDYLMKFLKARAYRAYPSIIRDIHFAKLLDENTMLDEVIFDKKLDVKEGIDVLVVENNQKYAINCYYNTRRSKEARIVKKKHRHKKSNEYVYVEFPINSNEGIKISDKFVLYGTKHVINILNTILKHQKQAS